MCMHLFSGVCGCIGCARALKHFNCGFCVSGCILFVFSVCDAYVSSKYPVNMFAALCLSVCVGTESAGNAWSVFTVYMRVLVCTCWSLSALLFGKKVCVCACV